MKTRKRAVGWRRRLWAIALAAVLVCALWSGTASAVQITDGSVPNEAVARPTVTIRGNVVVEKKKATGFYELALCVKTARTITQADGVTPVTEEDYLKDVTEHPENAGNYIVKNYPFQSAAATVQIDLDALTAVTWGAGQPVYSEWTPTAGTVGSYGAADGDYPRGIDLNSADNQEIVGLFTSLQPIIDAEQKDGNLSKVRVRLDTANPDEVTTAEAFIEDYDPVRKTALLTLAANTSTTSNVIYNEETPVVVVRFAYDRERFQNTNVEEAGRDFWLGLDKGDATEGPKGGQAALTYLADQNLDKAGERRYLGSDTLAAESSVHQVVWYTQNLLDDQVGQKDTSFYYYLGAEDLAADAQQSVWIFDNNTMTKITPWAPLTQGIGVLAKRGTLPHPPAIAGDPDAAETYSFFQNLLRKKDGTLKLKLVNAETYRKPTGGGGTTILFYDWDDSLIGSLVVDKGDVRAEVEEYIEENLVHPELRPSQYLVNDKVPETTDPNWAKYAELADSLAREYTYRGKYAYQVGKNDAVGPAGDTVNQGRADGEDYPLTNKLDYVFTKRVNSVAVEGRDTDGDGVVDAVEQSYVLPHKLTETELADAARYPYTYGWAVVEETAPKRAKDWKVMYDAAKLPDFWTTIGVGELSGVDPDYYDSGMAAAKTVPTPGAGAAMSYRAPQFLVDDNADWETAAKTGTYAYQLAADGAEGYLRFADFSNIDAELARYQKKNGTNKDTLIVKAVYEPGKNLALGNHYTLITEPAYSKFNAMPAENGGAYKVQLTLERSYVSDGKIVGTSRVREPIIRQDMTIDAKWITNEEKGIDHDLDNPSFVVSTQRTETTYSQVDIDNGEKITFSLSLSARHNKIDYQLTEAYHANYVAGTQRSYFNSDQLTLAPEKFVIDNYNYLLDGDSDIMDDLYDSDFATKEGSKGFVLSCTLGHMLEQATRYSDGEVTRDDYNSAVQYTNVLDTNICMDLSGTLPRYANNGTLQNAFLAAAAACENHKNDPSYDCWDVNLDCAKLTYHQAQWFLVDYQANPGADILPVSTAEDAGHKLSFCHYHISCSGGHVPKAPTNWDELIKLAQDANGTGDDATNAQADLAILVPADIEKITSLRTNATGGRYNATDKFVTDLTGAVKRLSDASLPLSWPNLQYAMLNPGSPPDQATMTKAAQDNYWWFDGSTSAPSLPAVTRDDPEAQWEYLLDAARATYIASTTALKDGSTGWTTTTRLAPAQAPFTSNQNYAGAANAAWRDLTHNLIFAHEETSDDGGTPDDDTDDVWEYKSTKFASFDDFKSRLLAAVQALDPLGDQELTWEDVQERILTDIDPADDLGENKPSADTKFWWKNGNTPFAITNLRTLMEAIRRVKEYDDDSEGRAQAALDRLTVADLEGEMFQTLRWSKTGQTVSELLAAPGSDWPSDSGLQVKRILDMLNQARLAIKNADNVTENWNAVQYCIVHYAQEGKVPDLSAMTNNMIGQEAYYYWWYKKGTGTAITFTPGADSLTNLTALMEATYRIDFADPKAVDSIVQAADSDPTKSLWTLTRLVQQKKMGTATRPNPDDNYDGPDTLDDVRSEAFPAGSAANVQSFFDDYLIPFRDAAKAAQGLAANGFQTPEFYWHELQYYILNHTYKDYNDPDVIATMVNPEGDYWWYSADERELPKAPAAGYTPEEIAADLEFMKNVNAALDGYLATGTITLTSKNANALNLMVSYNDAWSAPSLANLKKVLQKLGDDPEILNYITDGKVTLSWAQLQYYLETAVKAGKGKYTKAGTLVSTSDAVSGLINEFGWSESYFPADVIKKPLVTARSNVSRPNTVYAFAGNLPQQLLFYVPTTTTTRRMAA